MRPLTPDAITEDDAQNAIEIADRVWWVGHYLEGDPFQCHVYLIEHGDQSVLFDPGSALTFRHTLRKIEQVTSFSSIRYFVCHHQDPDITGALPMIDNLICRDDALLVTHWRAEALLRHYGLTLPFWRVDEHDWMLDLGGRRLRFVFTPYAHFPGAYVTFDEASGTLFSSDLFGGFTQGFSLIARDESYFEALRPFHEHYMPSQDVLQNALNAIKVLPLRCIAPQHGSILPQPLIGPMIDRLMTLECGLFLLARDTSDLQHLMNLNQALRDMMSTMIMTRDFADIARSLLLIMGRLLPAEGMEFYTRLPDGTVLRLGETDRFRGVTQGALPEPLLSLFTSGESSGPLPVYREILDGLVGGGCPVLVIPLVAPHRAVADAAVVVSLSRPLGPRQGLEGIISQMAVALQVVVERELLYRTLDLERQRFYETSIRDPLTGLFSRYYMQESLARLMDLQDRDPHAVVGVVLTDIDHFKRVNDGYGHAQGDVVLRAVARCLMDDLRPSDLPVRLGGEEFAIFVVGASMEALRGLADRLRTQVAGLRFFPVMQEGVTASFGVAQRRVGEALASVLERADAALYQAKEKGRNRVCVAP